MLVDATARSLIDRFLGRVEAHLTDRPEEERDELIDDLEAHIHDALARRESDTLADVVAVLAEMDPPKSYGSIPTSGVRGPKPKRSLEFRWMVRFAIAGVAGILLISVLSELFHPERNIPGEAATMVFFLCELAAVCLAAWILLKRRYAPVPVANRGGVYAGVSLFLFIGGVLVLGLATLAFLDDEEDIGGGLVTLFLAALVPAAAFGRAAVSPKRLPIRGDLQPLGRIAPIVASTLLLLIVLALPFGIFILISHANGATRRTLVDAAMPSPLAWGGTALVVGALLFGLFAWIGRLSGNGLKATFWPLLNRTKGSGGRVFVLLGSGCLLLAATCFVLYFLWPVPVTTT